ncbi:MAG: DUF4397 domain-containing protein [Terriglobales bacterium]|jgi:hypothetical protein
MLRLLKALPFALALAALSIFATSCGSGGSAAVRLINTIPDNGVNGSIALDIYFNNNLTSTSPLAVNTVQPAISTPAKYLNVPSGNDTIVAYDTGTKSNPVVSQSSETGLSSSNNNSVQYTLLFAGYTDAPPQLYVINDNNTPPAANTVKFRVIDGSAFEGANGLDVYLYQTGTIPPTMPLFSNLTIGMASEYNAYPFASGQPASIIEIVRHGGPILYNFPLPAFSPGEIMTVVLNDEPGGATINPRPIVMVDLLAN